MDWKIRIREWRKLPPEVQTARRQERAPIQAWQSMAFAREPVDLNWLKALHAQAKPHGTSTPPQT
jgi:hypothetical protein